MSDLHTKRLIVIVGPTAVGKTDLAIRLAKHLSTEIISADSRQVFQEMNIGTAKPSPSEQSQIKHHFIDIKSINDDYNAGQFERDVLALLDQLFAVHDDVIMCGGSGMYVKAVCEGFDEMPEVSTHVRKEIMTAYEEHGMAWLQQEVHENDPDYFAAMDQMNPHRLIRALEIIRATGLPASDFRLNRQISRPFEIQKIGLALERNILYERINNRVDQMIHNGLVEEARMLHTFKTRNALQTVGYQELFDYFDGMHDLDEAIRLIKRNSRRYAKRQLTWFKRDKEVRWFRPDQWDEILNTLNE